MSPEDIKKSFETAQRAYARAERAKTCGEAQNNLRLGQKHEQRARDALREFIPAKLEYRHYSQIQRHLFELKTSMASAESNAHQNRLAQCKISQMQYESAAAAARVDKTDASIERQYRKRTKRR